jgi:hypothetical protein
MVFGILIYQSLFPNDFDSLNFFYLNCINLTDESLTLSSKSILFVHCYWGKKSFTTLKLKLIFLWLAERKQSTKIIYNSGWFKGLQNCTFYHNIFISNCWPTKSKLSNTSYLNSLNMPWSGPVSKKWSGLFQLD